MKTTALSRNVPALLERAGTRAVFAADEFFSARISNPQTRRAYTRVVGHFLTWCEGEGIELAQVTPGLAGRFIEELPGSDPTKNQALSALRHFFDALVTRHAVALNSFASVRGRTYTAVEGTTPELSIAQARELLAAVDTTHLVGLRDRAVLGVLAYTGARVGAVSRLRIGDLHEFESERSLRFLEKGGKHREIPVRDDLEEWIEAYVDSAGLIDSRGPLFRTAYKRTRHELLATAMEPHAIRRMLKRRLRAAGLPGHISPHSFRVMVVTDLLSQDVPMEDVQYLAGHTSSRTTQLYDRRRRRVTRSIVEQISV